MARSIRYDVYGGPEVLRLVDAVDPVAGSGQLRLRVTAAGLNPADWKAFGGLFARGPAPDGSRGVGHDVSGVVDQVGAGVDGFAVGDTVCAQVSEGALADVLVLDVTDAVLPVPEEVDPVVAGALQVASRAAVAGLAAVGVGPGDVLLLSAAAGGVGLIAAQLAVDLGVHVVGVAGEANHPLLRDLGVVPVTHGDGLVDRVRAAAPAPVTAVLDLHGAEYVAAGIELGVPVERIASIAAPPDRLQGAVSTGGAHATSQDVAHVLDLVAAGRVRVPIAGRYPLELDAVREAYTRLRDGHVQGKLVVTPLR